jgi:hypothetical protein
MARKAKPEVVNEDATPAAASLAPGTHPVDDPKSKVEMIAKMIGAAHAMKSDELVKHFNSMMEYGKGVGHGPGIPDGNAAHNAGTLATHPSAASNIKEAIKADVATMLDGQEGLSEEFKTKAATLFEAAVEARIATEVVLLTEQLEKKTEDEFNQAVAGLVETLDQYLEYVAHEWLQENEVAIESSLRTEMAEEFIAGLRTLFSEHHINIPEEQTNVIDQMAGKIDELNSQVHDLITSNAELQEKVNQSEKEKTLEKLAEGLTLVESEKLKELSQGVDADNIEEFTKKVTILKESNFVKGAKKSVISETLEEVNEESVDEKKLEISSDMSRYMDVISRSVKTY